MSPPHSSPRSKPALAALNEQLAKLLSLEEADTEDPRFIKWHLETTEAFKRFLTDSNYRRMFLSLNFGNSGYFDPPYAKSDPRHPYKRGCVAAKVYLETAISDIERYDLEEADAAGTTEPRMNGVQVLISHSSKDKALAEAVINLLRSGLGILANQIRCTSVDGYRLRGGVDTNNELRVEIKTAKLLIGLLTSHSLSSTYVLFELGARWGADLPVIPLLAGTSPESMRGPQSTLNALSCDSEGQIIQFVEDVGRQLGITLQSASSYQSQIKVLKTLAAATPETVKAKSNDSNTKELEAEVQDLRQRNTELSRKPYVETLGKKVEILLSQMNAGGKLLLRYVLENEPVEVVRRRAVQTADSGNERGSHPSP
jgi:hypothetical protein